MPRSKKSQQKIMDKYNPCPICGSNSLFKWEPSMKGFRSSLPGLAVECNSCGFLCRPQHWNGITKK